MHEEPRINRGKSPGRWPFVVASGGGRIDNRKMRETFDAEAKMFDAETVVPLTGQPAGPAGSWSQPGRV